MGHVGVDLQKRLSQIGELTADGERRPHRSPTRRPAWNTASRRSPHIRRGPSKPPAPGGGWSTGSNAWGLSPSFPHPKATTAIAAARLTNDTVDAQRLALRRRASSSRPWGSRPPPGARPWSRLARRKLQPTRGRHWLTPSGPRGRSPPVPERSAMMASPGGRGSRRRSDASRRRFGQRWGDDPRVQRLTTIPGIGSFIALVLVLELGDIARFPRAKPVASYLGLTPRVRASSERARCAVRSSRVLRRVTGFRLVGGNRTSAAHPRSPVTIILRRRDPLTLRPAPP
jgi:hypothetical protein